MDRNGGGNGGEAQLRDNPNPLHAEFIASALFLSIPFRKEGCKISQDSDTQQMPNLDWLDMRRRH